MNFFQLIGPSYNLRNSRASLQRTINLVPVPLEPGNERTAWVFRDAPGLDLFSDPDPALILTSLIYPYMLTEKVDLAGDFDGGYCVQMLGPDEVNLAADFMAGELTATVAYVTYTHPPEAVDLSADFGAGELTVTTTYVTYTHPPESADLYADFEAGELTVTTTYVTYPNWTPEGVDLAADFDGGTLETA